MARSRLLVVMVVLALASLACSLGAAPPSAEPTPTAEATLAAPAPGAGDACLEGAWVMDTAAADGMLAELTGVSTLHVVAGSLTLTFDGEQFSYGSSGLTVRSDLPPSGYIEADATVAIVGGYTAADGMLAFNTESVTSDIGTWRASINGETVEVPGGGPAFSLTPPGSAPYRCSAAQLEVDANETVTMVFQRSG